MARRTLSGAAGALVRLSGLGKAFERGAPVLRDVNLVLERGELVSVVGPSGCGKTTLLRLVAGLVAPSEGQVTFAGAAKRRESLSFVFQDATLLPWLTVLDNVALPLKIAGTQRSEREGIALSHIERVGLAEAARLYPRQLSGGMKMRASIARAMTVDPTLLLLDEPFGALDEMTRDALNEELLRLRDATRWTALFVTHSVAEAVFLSSRVVVMATNPGGISQTIDVPLGYPRTAATRERREYVEGVVAVTRALHAVEPRQGKDARRAGRG